MVTGIIGRKVGMTQVFAAGRHRHARDRHQGGPVRGAAGQGRADRRLRGGAARASSRRSRPRSTRRSAGHYKKAGNVPPTRVRREVKLAPGGEPVKAGDQVLVGGVFNDGDRVDVIGISRGNGFQGVVKRHNFRGGAATHGSMFHRAPGSIGASSFPSRVVKGMRAAGRMGGDRVTVRNLKIVQVDGENNLLLIRGAVPGAPGSYVIVRKAVAAKQEAGAAGREGRQGDRREEDRARRTRQKAQGKIGDA